MTNYEIALINMGYRKMGENAEGLHYGKPIGRAILEGLIKDNKLTLYSAFSYRDPYQIYASKEIPNYDDFKDIIQEIMDAETYDLHIHRAMDSGRKVAGFAFITNNDNALIISDL